MAYIHVEFGGILRAISPKLSGRLLIVGVVVKVLSRSSQGHIMGDNFILLKCRNSVGAECWFFVGR